MAASRTERLRSSRSLGYALAFHAGAFAFGCSQPPSAGERAAPSASSAAEIVPGETIEVFDDSGKRGTVRIDAITRDPDDPELTFYVASVRANDAAPWEPYCLPDHAGRNAAIAVAGGFGIDGPRPEVEGVTLACTSGAIGKCIRLGYKPWETLPDGARMSDLITACTRMIRADYCGNGTPHTKDGTWIDVYDRFGIQKHEPKPGVPERFEAAWGPNGATYLTVGRWTDKVDEIVRECPEKLAGRVGPALSTEEIQRRFPETLLFNAHAVSETERLSK